eukprot:37725-Prorocentrum_minimum.AAC.2
MEARKKKKKVKEVKKMKQAMGIGSSDEEEDVYKKNDEDDEISDSETDDGASSQLSLVSKTSYYTGIILLHFTGPPVPVTARVHKTSEAI